MQFPSPFNARSVQPAAVGGAGNLPVGEYPCVIIESEIKATSDGNSGMLVLTMEATQGEHKGATGAWRLNLFNQNDKAKEIAQRQLSALCHVIGVYDISDSAQLHGKEFVAVVQLDTKNQVEYPGSTQVRGVKDMAGNDPGKAGAGARPVAPAPVAAPPAAAAPAAAWAPVAAPAAAPAAAPSAWAPAAAGAPAAGAGAPPWQR